MHIAEIDTSGVWLGGYAVVSDTAVCPPGWRVMNADPPALGEGEVAIGVGSAWQVVAAEHAPAPSLEVRKAALRAALEAAYRARLAADVAYDFGEAVAVDLAGETRAAGVLAMQMSQEDRENWQAKWSEALTAAPTDTLVIQCEDRWYVQGPPSLFLGAFRHVLGQKQQLLTGKKILERLIQQATTEADLDNVETAIGNPVWAIA